MIYIFTPEFSTPLDSKGTEINRHSKAYWDHQLAESGIPALRSSCWYRTQLFTPWSLWYWLLANHLQMHFQELILHPSPLLTQMLCGPQCAFSTCCLLAVVVNQNFPYHLLELEDRINKLLDIFLDSVALTFPSLESPWGLDLTHGKIYLPLIKRLESSGTGTGENIWKSFPPSLLSSHLPSSYLSLLSFPHMLHPRPIQSSLSFFSSLFPSHLSLSL